MKTYTTHKSYSVVFDACKKAINNCGFKITSSSRKEGYIDVSVGGSLLSWGESIEVDIKTTSSGKTKIIISSESKAQLIDWGTNSENEEILVSTIKKALK